MNDTKREVSVTFPTEPNVRDAGKTVTARVVKEYPDGVMLVEWPSEGTWTESPTKIMREPGKYTRLVSVDDCDSESNPARTKPIGTGRVRRFRK